MRARYAVEEPEPLVKIPASIHEINNCSILGYGGDLAEGHPGFHDEEYKTRRTAISDIARDHRMCVPPTGSILNTYVWQVSTCLSGQLCGAAIGRHVLCLRLAVCRGEPIPGIEYTPEEIETWATVLKQLRSSIPKWACKEYIKRCVLCPAFVHLAMSEHQPTVDNMQLRSTQLQRGPSTAAAGDE